MENINFEEFRNEKKIFVVESENYIIQYLKFFKFNEIFKERRINSIYFDRYDYRNYYETDDGEKYRSKTRLRWYGEIFSSNINGSLENKIKINNRNNKIINKIKNINFQNEICTKYIKNKIFSQLVSKNVTKIKLKNEQPTSIITYQRRYFKNNEIRITLDKNLLTKRLYNLDKLYKRNNFFSKNKFKILEIKYNEKNDEDVMQITNRFNYNIGKFSKYCFSLINQ